MTKKYAAENSETVVKFLRAMRNSALEVLSADPGEILDRMQAKYDIVANEDRGLAGTYTNEYIDAAIKS
jgi:hypothetical protein